MNAFTIHGRKIETGAAPYVIAEISANHNGELDRALALIRKAKDVGADAVKLQTFRADTITLDSHRPEFMITGGEWDGRRLYDLYEEAHTPWDWHSAMFDLGKELDIPVFSSPFDHSAVDFLETLDCPAYKIASPELIDLPLIAKAASTGKPLIISSGMGSEEEVDDAIQTARDAGAGGIALLHCVSGYPTSIDASNIGRIKKLQERYPDVVIGLSDHTRGIAVPVAATSFGVAVIEKHFTMSHEDGGLDAAFSLDADEFRELTATVAQIHAAINGDPAAGEAAQKGTRSFRRSLYVVADIRAGDILSETNVRSVRPANGLPPKHYWEVLGHRAARDIEAGEPLQWDMIE
jgi:pseudaminic acid synthase